MSQNPQTPQNARAERWEKLTAASPQQAFDVLVVGGGATGLGVAVDAAQRGFSVCVVEAHDYAKGTSSRATKLLHGGVRYLAQGNVALVREALHERTAVLRNAPELAQKLPFVMPAYQWHEAPFYGTGLKLYDLLAGSAGLGPTRLLSKQQILGLAPNTLQAGLKAGVSYWDAQFDDARLALALAMTAQSLGAVVLNHVAVTGLAHSDKQLVGAHVEDKLSGAVATVHAKCVINATGVWVDELRALDGKALERPVQHMVAPSQGVHVVVDSKFWPGEHALLVPKTADGRVLFVLPWLGSVILGTTDTPRDAVAHDPKALPEELDFILREAANYMQTAPTRADVKAVWAGMRPLVKPLDDDAGSTKSLSREHTILVSKSGLLTVTGGKWTTYRAMAEDVMHRAFKAGLLPEREGSTADLRLLASKGIAPKALSAEHVAHMALHEHAITVEDVLARRCRALFLDATLAVEMAPWVAQALEAQTGVSAQLSAFLTLAEQYQLN